MYRKVIRFLAVTLVLSLLAVAGEITVLASVRAPAQTLLAAAGASPQALADQVRPEALQAPAADGPASLANCKALAAGARPAGAAAAQLAPEPRINLGQVVILGQALARGTYANRTAPTGFETAFSGVTLPIRGKAPTLILAAAMLLVTVLVARRSAPALEEVIATASTPRVRALQPVEQRRLRRPWFAWRAPALVDRTADWERVRLVPT